MSTAPVTFRAFADRWQDTVLPLKKPATVATFRSHLGFFVSGPLGDKPLSALDTPTVQAVLTAQSKAVAPRTLRNRWRTLHTVLAAAHRERLLAELPKPALPRDRRRPDQPCLTAAQMRIAVHAAPDQYRAFYALLAETGMRIGEAVGLGPLDIDLDHRTLTIDRAVYNGRAGECKTVSSYRSLSLSVWLAGLLEPLVRKTDANQTVFRTSRGTPLWPAEVARISGPALAAAGLESAPFHAFRRGNITLSHTKVGMPEAILARRVGHKLAGMTLGVYCHPDAEADRPYVEAIAAALK